jgi:crotonobetainyl-CoA:carnitine CoA-transferase CaiB-like acyl-CoA transferase
LRRSRRWRVEAPKGDFVRWATPLIGGMGTTFIGNNLTKPGVVADLKTAEGLECARFAIAHGPGERLLRRYS